MNLQTASINTNKLISNLNVPKSTKSGHDLGCTALGGLIMLDVEFRGFDEAKQEVLAD